MSKLEICNIALQAIGQSAIHDFDEMTPAAEECRLRYDSVRRALLESYYWRFAEKRVALTKLTTTPAWGYGNEFALPADCIRVICTEEQLTSGTIAGQVLAGIMSAGWGVIPDLGADYKIEISANGQRVLRADEDSKNILYTYDTEATGNFSPLFKEYFALMLGDAMAVRMQANASLMDRVRQRIKDYKDQAELSSAKQGTQDRVERSIFLAVRN